MTKSHNFLAKTLPFPFISKRCDPCGTFILSGLSFSTAARIFPDQFLRWAAALRPLQRASEKLADVALIAFAALTLASATAAHGQAGWSSMGTSWGDDPNAKIASIAPRVSTSDWTSSDSFDERGLPSAPKPNVKAWKRPKQSSGLTGLRALITLAESHRDGYDAIHHSAKRLPKKRPSDMTIGEIFAWIDATPGQHHAIGFYQIIPTTLKSLVARSGISPTLKFTPKVQDHLGDILIADAGFNAFVSGELKASSFMDNLAKIWAGLPMANGRSAYHGKAGNRASVSRAFFEREMSRIFGLKNRPSRSAKNAPSEVLK